MARAGERCLPAEVLELSSERGHPGGGDRPLKEAVTRLVIPTYDVNTGKVYLFKMPHHPGCLNHADLMAVDVALATSAAPTYFPARIVPGRGIFIDGGLWADCPAMVGFVEAVYFLGQAPEQIRLLSLSTTSYPFRIGQKEQFSGLLVWSTKIIETLMFGQAQAAIAEVRCLLRHGLFHRIDYLTEPRLYHMDNASCIQQLFAIGRSTAELELNEHMSVVQTESLNGQMIKRFQLN